MQFICMPVPSECQNIPSLNSFSSTVPLLLELPLHVGMSVLLKLCAPGRSRHLDPSLWKQCISPGATQVTCRAYAEPGVMNSLRHGLSLEVEEPAWIQ